ncbi:MAG: hypothetical protein ACKVQB_00270 [Bacteroidia bacterium]
MENQNNNPEKSIDKLNDHAVAGHQIKGGGSDVIVDYANDGSDAAGYDDGTVIDDGTRQPPVLPTMSTDPSIAAPDSDLVI